MKIERTGEAVSVEGKSAFKMDIERSVSAILGNGTNRLYEGARYCGDFLVRDEDDNVVDKWFVQKYGWRGFWPPSATIPRVEGAMRKLELRAARRRACASGVIEEVLKIRTSLPVWGKGYQGEDLPAVCGLSRRGDETQYGVSSDGWWSGTTDRAVQRTALGDRFVRAVDLCHDAYGQLGRFREIFSDLILDRCRVDERKIGIHRFVVGDRTYWFRLYHVVRGRSRVFAIESLDEFGTGETSETVI